MGTVVPQCIETTQHVQDHKAGQKRPCEGETSSKSSAKKTAKANPTRGKKSPYMNRPTEHSLGIPHPVPEKPPKQGVIKPLKAVNKGATGSVVPQSTETTQLVQDHKPAQKRPSEGETSSSSSAQKKIKANPTGGKENVFPQGANVKCDWARLKAIAVARAPMPHEVRRTSPIDGKVASSIKSVVPTTEARLKNKRAAGPSVPANLHTTIENHQKLSKDYKPYQRGNSELASKLKQKGGTSKDLSK